ncbi:MAG: CAP domain-containing protein [Actinomycetota bacterium]|nr:CAP domain-containing protein [Actinomycetota bacterium]MDQ2956213.1 CAP domain-containing protein [Actinomycetota bacterium]
MAARSAPMLGLAVASVLLTAVGVGAMRAADPPKDPVSFAGAVLAPSSSAVPSTTRSAARKPSPARTSKALVRKASTAPTSRATTSYPPPSPTAKPTPVVRSIAAPPRTITSLTSQSEDSWARAVFDAVNQARSAQHLPALAWSSRLQASAHQHNLAMASANTLAHQVGNEDSLGSRESKAGVRWSFAAENIGWTTDRSLSGALGIEASMLAESAPDDAHRRNILSKDAGALGVDVLIDASHGRLWLTEDFADVS